MKIVEIIHSLNPGGAERLLVDLSNQLSSTADTEVFVVVLKNRDDRNENFLRTELSDKIRFIPMGFGDGGGLTYLIKVYKKIKEIEPNIVHIHCQIHYLLFAFFFYSKCKYVYTLHSKAEALLNGYRKTLATYLAKKNRLTIVSISETNRVSVRKYLGLNNDEIIHNGRSKPQITTKFEEVSSFVAEIKKSHRDIVLLSVARCVETKNLGLLISSVNDLVQRGIGLHLIVVGDNYFDTVLGQKLREMACDRIHFVGPKHNMGDYFSVCDGFCLSSSFEGMPITILEAYAVGCLPISTPVSGAVDVIENNKNGFLSSDFSLEGYKNALERFIDGRKDIKKENLIKLYDQKFSIEKCAAMYRNLFIKLQADI